MSKSMNMPMSRMSESMSHAARATNIRHGRKDELGQLLLELVLLIVPNIREYFYTEIRFSTPGSAPSSKSADTWCRSRGQPRTHACTQQQQLLHQHARRYMHTGSCMPVHPACTQQQQQQHACMPAHSLIHSGPCMPVHSRQLLLMRACARRAYCKKCRVNLGSKRSGWPNILVF